MERALKTAIWHTAYGVAHYFVLRGFSSTRRLFFPFVPPENAEFFFLFPRRFARSFWHFTDRPVGRSVVGRVHRPSGMVSEYRHNNKNKSPGRAGEKWTEAKKRPKSTGGGPIGQWLSPCPLQDP